MSIDLRHGVPFLVLALHAVGIVTAIHAIMKTRTSQGAIAWALALITVPYAALPLYWVFGRDRFVGYVAAKRQEGRQIETLRAALALAARDAASLPGAGGMDYGVFSRLAQMPFMTGNKARLLVDGKETFDAILSGIDAALQLAVMRGVDVRIMLP